MSDNALGRYLKTLRKSFHYTQEFVSSQLDVSRQAYSHYETGRVIPPYDICIRLASIYHQEAKDFLQMAISSSDFGTEHSLNTSSEKEDFLNFLEEESNQKRMKLLTSQEKELLYYFDSLKESDREDILDFLKIKYRKTKKKFDSFHI